MLFRVLTQHMSHSVFNLGPRAFSLPTAMEKAQGTRLIVCCLEVLSLRPFYTFFVYCRMRSLILGLLVGKEKRQKKKKKKNGEEVSN